MERVQRAGRVHPERQAEVRRGIAALEGGLEVGGDHRPQPAASAAGDRHRAHGQPAVGRVAHQPEVARLPGRPLAGRGKQFEPRPAAPLVKHQPQRVIPRRRHLEHSQRVGRPARVRIGNGERTDGEAETVIAVHAEGPRPGAGKRDRGGGLDHEVFHVHPEGLAGERPVVPVVAVAAGVEVVDHRRGLADHAHLLGRVVQHALGHGQGGDLDAGLDVAHRKARHLGLVAEAVRPGRPGRVVVPRLHPGRARATVRGHQIPTRRAGGQQDIGADLLGDPVRDIPELLGETGRQGGGDRAVRPHQRQVLAAGGQVEAGVQGRARHGAVLARGKHHQKTARLEAHRREAPFGEVVGVVREEPPVEVHRDGAGVVQLDPVRVIPVLVRQRAPVAGHELGDDDFLPAGRAARQPHRQQAGTPARHPTGHEPPRAANRKAPRPAGAGTWPKPECAPIGAAGSIAAEPEITHNPCSKTVECCPPQAEASFGAFHRAPAGGAIRVSHVAAGTFQQTRCQRPWQVTEPPRPGRPCG